MRIMNIYEYDSQSFLEILAIYLALAIEDEYDLKALSEILSD